MKSALLCVSMLLVASTGLHAEQHAPAQPPSKPAAVSKEAPASSGHGTADTAHRGTDAVRHEPVAKDLKPSAPVTKAVFFVAIDRSLAK